LADPEQLYAEVLQEEQQKGSSGPVAEGRAKAARARAEAGSPHPKEPKWWPGAQPHFEGGNGAAPAEEEPAAQTAEEAAEEPAPTEQPAAEAAEQPAAEAPAEQPAAEAPAEQPAAQAPEQPAAQAPAQPPAAEQPAAQGGVAVAARPTTGVSHGTASGNRLRPEDGVSTEAQFEGQRAMYDRRKLIDELVATGVPAVAAADSGRARAPWLSVLYLLIPLAVVAFLLANAPAETPPTAEPPPASGGGGGGVATDSLVAEGTEFDADTIRLEPKKETDFEIENRDTVVHNLVVYQTEEEATDPNNALFKGPDVLAGATESFPIDPLKKGDYFFNCQYHANMNGAVEVG
jgi:plastocyanin